MVVVVVVVFVIIAEVMCMRMNEKTKENEKTRSTRIWWDIFQKRRKKEKERNNCIVNTRFSQICTSENRHQANKAIIWQLVTLYRKVNYKVVLKEKYENDENRIKKVQNKRENIRELKKYNKKSTKLKQIQDKNKTEKLKYN